MVWRAGLSGDATLVGFTANGVLLRMRGALAMLASADGAVQWLSPLEEDVGRSLVGDEEPEVALVEGAVLVYRGGWNQDPLVEVRDARSGRLQRRVEPQGRIVAATIHAGQVHVLCHRQDKLSPSARARCSPPSRCLAARSTRACRCW